jgi:hypothetical protein
VNRKARTRPARGLRLAFLSAVFALTLPATTLTSAGAAAAGAAPPSPSPKATEVPPPMKASGQKTADSSDCSPASLDAKAKKAKPVTDSRAPKEYQGKKVYSCVKVNAPGATKERAAARDSALTAVQRQDGPAPGEKLLKDRLKAAKAAKAGDKKAKALLADNVPLPEWCYIDEYSGWVWNRTEQCQIADILVEYYVEVNEVDVLIGNAGALEFGYNQMSGDIDTVYSQIRVRKYWGEGAGEIDFLSAVYGSSECSGDCKSVSDTGLQPGDFAMGVNNDGQAYYDNTRIESGGIGYAVPTWHWFVHQAFFEPSDTRDQEDPPRIRCDNAFRTDGNEIGDPETFNASGVLGNGCVVPSYVPTWILRKSGFNPTVAYHVEAAQKSGLPGAYPNGPVLHRLQDSARKRQNGDRACPPSPAWIRPAGKSCDEYPMRSTYEGANSAPVPGTARSFAPPTQSVPNVGEWCEMDAAWNVPTGVTGPTGWSSCMLPARDNSGAGGQLSSFYRSNRVLDNDPFLVWVQ